MARGRNRKPETQWDVVAAEIAKTLVKGDPIRGVGTRYKPLAINLHEQFGEKKVIEGEKYNLENHVKQIQTKLADGRFSFQFLLMLLYGAGYEAKEVRFTLPVLSAADRERIQREAPQETPRNSPNKKSRKSEP